MKRYPFLLLVSIAGFSCSNPARDAVLYFIPGTYAREVSNDMSKGRDTLQISLPSGLSYKVVHSGTSQRILDGKLLQPEHKMETWTALYDESEGVLKETKRGRILSFQVEKNLLFVGASPYKKISQ